VDKATDALLSVRELTRRFGGFTAVQKVSFTLEKGEILGLIGPNGSGKSTTFNLIAGALAPSEGSIRLHGREIGGAMPNEVCRAGGSGGRARRGLGRRRERPRQLHDEDVHHVEGVEVGVQDQLGAVTDGGDQRGERGGRRGQVGGLVPGLRRRQHGIERLLGVELRVRLDRRLQLGQVRRLTARGLRQRGDRRPDDLDPGPLGGGEVDLLGERPGERPGGEEGGKHQEPHQRQQSGAGAQAVGEQEGRGKDHRTGRLGTRRSQRRGSGHAHRVGRSGVRL